MNELKPEDVMKALECCSAEISTRENCSVCPMGGKRDCMTILYREALALLREKDATLEMCAETIERQDKELAQKDAEIERLKNSITFQVVMPDEKMEEIKAECLKRVDELGNQRWISVKDRFPEPYEGVLVWGKDTGGVRWGMYSPYHSIWKDGTISHWMQLPEPPETKDDFPNCKISGCEAARKDCHIDCPYGKENSHGSK